VELKVVEVIGVRFAALRTTKLVELPSGLTWTGTLFEIVELNAPSPLYAALTE